MDKKINKTIIVSSYAPPSLGGPQNLYNLLRDTDPNSYCILTSFYNINNVSAKIGTWLKGEYIYYDSKFTTKKLEDKSIVSKFTTQKRSFVTKLKFLVKRNKLIKNIIGIPIILIQILNIVLKGKKIIKDKNIDSIVAISDHGPAMIGSYILHRITKKRYNIFIFDIYKGNYLLFPYGMLANILEPLMFKSADKIIVTNEGTRDFYKKKYGLNIYNKIVIIHNSTFKEPYGKIKYYESNQSKTIVFTGRIDWPQIGALKNLIKSVEEIKDINIKIKIYSPSPKDYLREIGIVESENLEIGVVSPTEIPEIQSNADILFLPLSWHTKSQAIIDTATPGKLTDYLIAGRPILIHAPATTFLAKYAKENNFALVVDVEDNDIIKKAIIRIINDKEYANTLVTNAKKTFYKNHDAGKNSLKLQEIINNTL